MYPKTDYTWYKWSKTHPTKKRCHKRNTQAAGNGEPRGHSKIRNWKSSFHRKIHTIQMCDLFLACTTVQYADVWELTS